RPDRRAGSTRGPTSRERLRGVGHRDRGGREASVPRTVTTPTPLAASTWMGGSFGFAGRPSPPSLPPGTIGPPTPSKGTLTTRRSHGMRPHHDRRAHGLHSPRRDGPRRPEAPVAAPGQCPLHPRPGPRLRRRPRGILLPRNAAADVGRI